MVFIKSHQIGLVRCVRQSSAVHSEYIIILFSDYFSKWLLNMKDIIVKVSVVKLVLSGFERFFVGLSRFVHV